MCKKERNREAVYQVWRRAFEDFQRRRPAACREKQSPSIDALLTILRRYDSVDALVASYWEPGDPPGALLLQHLPEDPSPDALVELEHVAFWLRYQELMGNA